MYVLPDVNMGLSQLRIWSWYIPSTTQNHKHSYSVNNYLSFFQLKSGHSSQISEFMITKWLIFVLLKVWIIVPFTLTLLWLFMIFPHKHFALHWTLQTEYSHPLCICKQYSVWVLMRPWVRAQWCPNGNVPTSLLHLFLLHLLFYNEIS